MLKSLLIICNELWGSVKKLKSASFPFSEWNKIKLSLFDPLELKAPSKLSEDKGSEDVFSADEL